LHSKNYEEGEVAKFDITYTSPLFCKNGTTHQISVLQENQEDGSVKRTTNALEGRIPLTILVIPENAFVTFLNIIGDN
jgi:hypothetical protein